MKPSVLILLLTLAFLPSSTRAEEMVPPLPELDPLPSAPIPATPTSLPPLAIPPSPSPGEVTLVPPLPQLNDAQFKDPDAQFEVNTKNAKKIPREDPAPEPHLPLNTVPITVKPAPVLEPSPHTPAEPVSPPHSAKNAPPPALPSLPALLAAPMIETPAGATNPPATNDHPADHVGHPGHAAHTGDHHTGDHKDVKETYEERHYREQEQRAATIARRLKETHRDWPIAKELVIPSDGNTHLPTLVTAEMLRAGLFDAIDSDQLASVRSLVERLGSTEIRNARGETPLIHAVKAEKIDVVRLLLLLKAAPNNRDTRNLSPLHYAVMARNRPLAVYLISMGADIHAADANGVTALSLAERYGLADIAGDFAKTPAQ